MKANRRTRAKERTKSGQERSSGGATKRKSHRRAAANQSIGQGAAPQAAELKWIYLIDTAAPGRETEKRANKHGKRMQRTSSSPGANGELRGREPATPITEPLRMGRRAIDERRPMNDERRAKSEGRRAKSEPQQNRAAERRVRADIDRRRRTRQRLTTQWLLRNEAVQGNDKQGVNRSRGSWGLRVVLELDLQRRNARVLLALRTRTSYTGTQIRAWNELDQATQAHPSNRTKECEGEACFN